MKQGLEIERKFLLKQVPFAYANTNGLYIDQYYVHDEEGPFRIRQTYDSHRMVYDKTHKEFLRNGVYRETIIDIQHDLFMTLKRKAHRRMEKTRLHAPHTTDGLTWEIDVPYDPIKLVLAEIEMPIEDYGLIIPDFIQEVLIMEVTHLKEFTNYALSTPINQR